MLVITDGGDISSVNRSGGRYCAGIGSRLNNLFVWEAMPTSHRRTLRLSVFVRDSLAGDETSCAYCLTEIGVM